MKTLNATAALILALTYVASAGAATKRHPPQPLSLEPRDLTVPVMQYPIENEDYDPPMRLRGKVELETEYTAFDNLSAPSFAPDASTFGHRGIPGVFGKYVTRTRLIGSQLAWNGEFGAGALALRRVGSVPVGRISQSGDQTLFMVPGYIGAELESPALEWRGIRPSLNLAALPTYGTMNESILGDRQSYVGVFGTVGLEAKAELSTLVNRGWPEVVLGVHRNFGKVGPLNLAGTELSAGLRIGL